MSILNKQLNPQQLSTLDLFLNGALAPLGGFLGEKDHISVLTSSRLANGYLWPLPFVLELTPAEKLQAQHSQRIALMDEERRILAEVEVNNLYRLPCEIAQQNNKKPNAWYAAGTIRQLAKILHPAFNRIRHTASKLKNNLHKNGWNSIIAVSGHSPLNQQDMQKACQWLKANTHQAGGILLQVNANDDRQELHQEMRELRSLIRCNAAKQVKLSLIPQLKELDEKQQLLLQALIAKNYGATGFLINSSATRSAKNRVLMYRDEIGLDIRPAKRSTATAEIPENQKTHLELAA